MQEQLKALGAAGVIAYGELVAADGCTPVMVPACQPNHSGCCCNAGRVHYSTVLAEFKTALQSHKQPAHSQASKAQAE
jgi:hypothetical protein